MNKSLLSGLVAVLVLAACGGGGGSSSTATPGSGLTKSVVSEGTITGFGSVIVNGVHFDTSKADISISGTSGHHQSELSVGQRVKVTGTRDDHGVHTASHVEYEAELNGAVTAIDTAARSFTALGQTVRVDDAAIFLNIADLSALAVGDFVEVSGSRAADGAILASFVKKEPAEAEVELRGSISNLDATAKTFSIGTQPVDYSSAVLVPSGFSPADGIFVEAQGKLNSSGVLIANKVKNETEREDAEHGSEAELEGIIRDVAGDRSSFHINDALVRVSSNTVYVGGTADNLVAGVKAEVEGVIASDNALVASKVKFEAGETHKAQGSIDASITAIDATAKTFTVLGVVISTADNTVYRDSRDDNRMFGFANLVVGDYVEVGFTNTAGKLTATRVEREKARSDSRLRGLVDSFDAGARSLRIAGVPISTSGASYHVRDSSVTADQFYGQLSSSSIVKVKGSFSAGVFTATEAELEVEDD